MKREAKSLRVAKDEAGQRLKSPSVGVFWPAYPDGAWVGPGAAIGELEVLGHRIDLRLPAKVGGGRLRWVQASAHAVAYDQALATLEFVGEQALEAGAEAGAVDEGGALVFRAPSSGRYYARPSPERPPFVQVGDTVTAGQTIALLEVMKTFARIQYGGEGLPSPAKILRIFPEHEDELSAGDPILEVEV